MPQVCTVCNHPKSREIDLAVLDPKCSKRKIAIEHKITEPALFRHIRSHLAERLRRALKRSEERRELDLSAELARCFHRVNLLFTACDAWLRDPEDPEAYTVEPRAGEVTVVYDEILSDGRKRRRRSKLQTLLNKVNKKRAEKAQAQIDLVEAKYADPRKLVLLTAQTLDRHLRMLGDLTGEFKQPAANPIDDKARIEKAIEMWIEECRRRGVKNPTRQDALRYLTQRRAPASVEFMIRSA